MDANLIGKRIFFIFGLLVIGALLVYGYAGKVLAPLAVTLLPTSTAQAHYARSAGYYLYQTDSTSRMLHIPVDFDGHTETLTMVIPETPHTQVALIDPDKMPPAPEPDPTRFFNPKPQPAEPEKVYPVRYVAWWPSSVMLDRPNASLRTYYADLWRVGDSLSFCFVAGFFAAFAYLFYRHLRGVRR